MRLTFFGAMPPPPADAPGEVSWDIGALVLRAAPSGGVFLDLGPADGPTKFRLALGQDVAQRLVAGLRRVHDDGSETVVLA
jgi:hypothetical protein